MHSKCNKDFPLGLVHCQCAQKCIYTFMSSVHYVCPVLTKTETAQQFFIFFSNIKFHEKIFIISHGIICVQADTRIE